MVRTLHYVYVHTTHAEVTTLKFEETTKERERENEWRGFQNI